jgi:hypothetical protein
VSEWVSEHVQASAAGQGNALLDWDLGLALWALSMESDWRAPHPGLTQSSSS